MNAKEQGLSLHDIAGYGEDVDIGGSKTLKVKGISAYGILLLLRRYPDLQNWLAGGNLAVSDLVLQGPDVMAAIIAAGTGLPGDTDAEDAAATLPVEAQMDIIEAVYRQTFRSGFGPFVQRVQKLYADAVASGSFGVDPGTKSPQASKPSLQPGTTPNESGTTPPAK